MDKGSEKTDHGKRSSRKKEHPPRPQQSAYVHRQGPNEHQPDVVRAADPGAVVITKSEITF